MAQESYKNRYIYKCRLLRLLFQRKIMNTILQTIVENKQKEEEKYREKLLNFFGNEKYLETAINLYDLQNYKVLPFSETAKKQAKLTAYEAMCVVFPKIHEGIISDLRNYLIFRGHRRCAEDYLNDDTAVIITDDINVLPKSGFLSFGIANVEDGKIEYVLFDDTYDYFLSVDFEYIPNDEIIGKIKQYYKNNDLL